MKKVLILCAHRPGRSPSQRYRFEQYLPFLESRGFTFRFSSLLNEKDDRAFYADGGFLKKVLILIKTIFIRLKDWRRFDKFDLIFIQREALFLGTSFFEKRAYRSGARVIFDFDDSIWLADTSPGNRKWEWIKKPSKFYSNIQHAHTVIAGNRYLAEKANPFNSNTVIIPTTIDTSLHIPKPEPRNSGVVTIGWSGSISTIKHFEMLLPVLLKLKQNYSQRIAITILGPAAYTIPELDLQCIQWSEASEVDTISSFDIGLMPLPDDEWSRGKCGLKGLSYMACGVATIMSAVGVNKDIIRHGENGFLAGNPDEWYELIRELTENPELRQRFGNEGRKTVEERYSVNAQRENYLRVFENRLNPG